MRFYGFSNGRVMVLIQVLYLPKQNFLDNFPEDSGQRGGPIRFPITWPVFPYLTGPVGRTEHRLISDHLMSKVVFVNFIFPNSLLKLSFLR